MSQDSNNPFEEMIPKPRASRPAEEVGELTQEAISRTAYVMALSLAQVLVNKGILKEDELLGMMKDVFEEYKKRGGK